MVPLSFANEQFLAVAGGGLFWPRRDALLLADLHLEKASSYARWGQLLPPHDSFDTLAQVETLIDRTGAREVWCLGDSFHDPEGPSRLQPTARARLDEIMARVEWTWIMGNHDPFHQQPVGGHIMSESHIDGFTLRHAIDPRETGPEISGHWHPKLRLNLRGHRISRPCFVRSRDRLVLPAFGSFTGGMRADDPALLNALSAPAEALIISQNELLRFPLG